MISYHLLNSSLCNMCVHHIKMFIFISRIYQAHLVHFHDEIAVYFLFHHFH